MQRYVLFLCTAPFLMAQASSEVQISVTPPTPNISDTVILEVIGVTEGRQQTIRWTKQSGQSAFPSNALGHRVEFKPTVAGDVITIQCDWLGAKTGSLSKTFTIAQEQTAPGPAGPPARQPAAQQQLPPPQKPEPWPVGLTKIEDIVDPNKDLVVPSGFMGDARPELGKGASHLTGGNDCKFESAGCYSISYDMSHLPETSQGYTGYAWQVLPQGSEIGYNFGQSPGVDLSRMGYKSLQFYARAAPNSALKTPKVEFKSGGNIDPKLVAAHPHTYIASRGAQSLSGDWHPFCLDISKADLRDVVSPLTVVVSSVLNPPVSVEIDIDGASFSKEACHQ